MSAIKTLKTLKGNIDPNSYLALSSNKTDIKVKLQDLLDLIDTNIVGEAIPYKKYVAQLRQTGTSAPGAEIVFENTLENELTFYYDGVGLYRISCADFGDLSEGKVWVMIGPPNQNNGTTVIDAYATTAPLARDPDTLDCEIALESFSTGTATNGLIFSTAIEIRVYE